MPDLYPPRPLPPIAHRLQLVGTAELAALDYPGRRRFAAFPAPAKPRRPNHGGRLPNWGRGVIYDMYAHARPWRRQSSAISRVILGILPRQVNPASTDQECRTRGDCWLADPACPEIGELGCKAALDWNMRCKDQNRSRHRRELFAATGSSFEAYRTFKHLVCGPRPPKRLNNRRA